jgi:hypothetical protein
MARGVPIPSGVSYTLRMTKQEMDAARVIGNGNAAEGIRIALRYCHERDLKAQPLSSILRSAAWMAKELEEVKERKLPRRGRG